MELPLRRRAWLTREGWYYLAVLGFIVGGSVLRHVNLLVVLAGMMLAPLVLNWRMVMASLRGLSVRRRLPAQATAGQPFTVELAVKNHRSSFSSWLIRLQDQVRRVEPGHTFRFASLSLWSPSSWKSLVQQPGLTLPEAILEQAPAGATTIATYRMTIHRRGRYRFGPIAISTRYPLGLVRGRIRFQDQDELLVFPRLGRLSDRWNELAEADLLGDERRHPQRGFAEGDYYGLRPWQTGDSQRWIHWRTTAKLNTPTVRQFERQRSHDVAIVLDAWLPAEPREEDVGQLELAISLAATAVADMGHRGGGTLTFVIASESPQCWSGPASPVLVEEILLALASLTGGPQADWPETTDLLQPALAATGIALAISPRSQSQWASATASPTSAVGATPILHWIDVGSAELEELFTLE